MINYNEIYKNKITLSYLIKNNSIIEINFAKLNTNNTIIAKIYNVSTYKNKILSIDKIISHVLQSGYMPHYYII